MIVMKFGGSSVESAAAIDRVASIVRSRLHRHPVVVVSAMGKTTNRLLAIAQSAVQGDRASALAQLSELRAYTLREGGPVGGAVDAHLQELAELVQGLAVLGELTPRSIDAISAYGERLSSLIVAERFRANSLDAVQADSRQYIVTDARHTQAAPLPAETYERLRNGLAPIARQQVVVMGGFIGATASGVTTTLGRGGSDFSASIIGAGLDAEEIQIWTDVDGMLTCDPRIADIGHRIKVISFGEAAVLVFLAGRRIVGRTVLIAGLGLLVLIDLWAARQRLREIMAGSPRIEDYMTRVWETLSVAQREAVDAKLNEYRERETKKREEAYVRQRVTERQPDGPPGRPAAANAERRERLMQLFERLSPEQQEVLLERLESAARDGGFAPGRQRGQRAQPSTDKPAPGMDEVDVPKPAEVEGEPSQQPRRKQNPD